jgi:AbrB family transcriptional regulator (stage V sporulation protein T)
MKSTGIVRRIDDLGRVVVPKEIRRTLGLRDGDPLEMFLDGKSLILQKYDILGSISGVAKSCAKALHKSTGYNVAITNLSSIIAISSVRMEGTSPIDSMLHKLAHPLVLEVMDKKEHRTFSDPDVLFLTESGRAYSHGIVLPIIHDGDPIGSIIVFTFINALTSKELELMKVMADVIINELEE